MKINILGSEYKIIETLDYTEFPFLKECAGYHDWSTKELIIKDFINEEMIDWFAIQSPKIIKVYKELGIEK